VKKLILGWENGNSKKRINSKRESKWGIGPLSSLKIAYYIKFEDAQARLNGRRMHCRSTQTAEHLACIFGIGTLFILCNPGCHPIFFKALPHFLQIKSEIGKALQRQLAIKLAIKIFSTLIPLSPIKVPKMANDFGLRLR